MQGPQRQQENRDSLKFCQTARTGGRAPKEDFSIDEWGSNQGEKPEQQHRSRHFVGAV
jgi:hypothetical protein